MKTLNFFTGTAKKAFAIITNTKYNWRKYSVQVVETDNVRDFAEYGFDEHDFDYLDNLSVGGCYTPEQGIIVNRLA